MHRLTPRGLEESHLKGDFRLACRCAVSAFDGVVRGHTLGRGQMQIQAAAVNWPSSLRAADLDPAVTRVGDRVLLDGDEIARSTKPLHGVAVDLGTTTVVVRALDLISGATVATVSFENPQRFGGTDVMARIQFDTENPGRLLQRTLLGYLTRAIEQFPIDPKSVYEFAVAGNSTMRDLFFGLNVHSIGQKPYWSATQHELTTGRRTSTALTKKASELRLPGHPSARVYGLPLVGGHVGADAAACLLALQPHLDDRLVAIMDIGTNTELFIGNRHKLVAASCPAGPAFEGRGIVCGMPGLDGAIARVELDVDGCVSTQVIGDGAPEGICGSGLIDLLGELLRTGKMNRYGRFTDDEHTFVVDRAHEIVLHESDVNELAQAKGANVAGLLTATKTYGCTLDELDGFYLAGGFGRYLNVDSAKRIGLIPDLPSEKIVQVGNTAIEGAAIALRSCRRRRELEELVKRIEHVELETDPNFFDHFVTGCQFHPINASEGTEI
jgi:uncharacterized 2Fe-2S/4Fe-4S cluster protein (DUF4445 family)